MAAVQGRKHRKDVADTVLVRARVHRDHKAKVEEIARRLGISTAAYLEALIAHERVDADGRPEWWGESVPGDQEELPLADTA